MSTSRGDLKLVTHPDRAPACDFITRTTVGPFVDTGVDVLLRSQPGNPIITERVYLSVSTIRQLAQIAGLGAGDSESEQESIAEYEARLMAQGKLDGLKEGLGDDLANIARTLRQWLDTAGRSSDRRSRS